MANTDLLNFTGTFAWVSGITGGSNGPEEDRARITRCDLRRASSRSDRPGGLTARVTIGPWEGRMSIAVYVTDDGQPPLPTSTVGTLKVISVSGQNYQFKAVIVGFRFGYDTLAKAAPQMVEYDCEVTSTAITDTVQLNQ